MTDTTHAGSRYTARVAREDTPPRPPRLPCACGGVAGVDYPDRWSCVCPPAPLGEDDARGDAGDDEDPVAAAPTVDRGGGST